MARRIGPYEVVRELGRGGMGVVFEVRDPALPRRLALKLILDKADPEALARFGREVELLARVRHPNVVAVHCVGRAPDGPYVVMDLVEGEPLSRRVGGLEPERAVELVRALCDAVGALHAQRILHRDLKPQNVIVRPDGAPVLLDFGLARSAGAQSLTQTGALVGTPRYMAPEQAEGKGAAPLDERTDVYGLGAILFELLAGEPPFADVDGGPWAVIVAVVQREPRWPDAARGLTPALQEVLRRAMAKRPDDRYASARELKRALGLALAGAIPRSPRRRAPVIVALSAALLGGVGLAVAALAARSSAPQADERHVAPLASGTSSGPELPEARREAEPETFGPRLVLEHPETSGPYQAARGYWIGPGRLVTAGGRELRLWDVTGSAREPLAITPVPLWLGRSGAMTGDRLVLGGTSGVQAFARDLRPLTEKVMAVSGFEDLEVFAVAFAPGRKQVAYGYEEGGGAVHVSSPELEPVLHSLPAPQHVHDLVFSPAGDRLVCAAGGTTGSPAVLRSWSFGGDGATPAHDHDESLLAPTLSLAYSPDGRELVGGTTAAAVLRFTPDGRGTPHVLSERGWTTVGFDGEVPRLHAETVFDLAFSADGALLFTLGGDGERTTIRVFETRSWTCVAGPVPTSRRAFRLAPEPDGRRLLVGRSGGVEVWDVPDRLAASGR